MSKAFTKKTNKDHSCYEKQAKTPFDVIAKAGIKRAMTKLTMMDRLTGNIQYGDYYQR